MEAHLRQLKIYKNKTLALLTFFFFAILKWNFIEKSKFQLFVLKFRLFTYNFDLIVLKFGLIEQYWLFIISTLSYNNTIITSENFNFFSPIFDIFISKCWQNVDISKFWLFVNFVLISQYWLFPQNFNLWSVKFNFILQNIGFFFFTQISTLSSEILALSFNFDFKCQNFDLLAEKFNFFEKLRLPSHNFDFIVS